MFCMRCDSTRHNRNCPSTSHRINFTTQSNLYISLRLLHEAEIHVVIFYSCPSSSLSLLYIIMIHYYYQARQWGRHGVGTAAEWDPVEVVARLAAESAVVIFSRSKCCMCHAVKRLFHGMGVGPAVHELDRDQHGKEIEGVLAKFLGSSRLVPVVFVGGRLVGSMDREFDGPLYWAEIYLTGPDGGPYHYC